MKRRTVVALLIGVAGFLRPFTKTPGQGPVEGDARSEHDDRKGNSHSDLWSMTGTFRPRQSPRPMLELNLDDFSGLLVRKASQATQLTADEIWEVLRGDPTGPADD